MTFLPKDHPHFDPAFEERGSEALKQRLYSAAFARAAEVMSQGPEIAKRLDEDRADTR